MKIAFFVKAVVLKNATSRIKSDATYAMRNLDFSAILKLANEEKEETSWLLITVVFNSTVSIKTTHSQRTVIITMFTCER